MGSEAASRELAPDPHRSRVYARHSGRRLSHHSAAPHVSSSISVAIGRRGVNAGGSAVRLTKPKPDQAVLGGGRAGPIFEMDSVSYICRSLGPHGPSPIFPRALCEQSSDRVRHAGGRAAYLAGLPVRQATVPQLQNDLDFPYAEDGRRHQLSGRLFRLKDRRQLTTTMLLSGSRSFRSPGSKPRLLRTSSGLRAGTP
jgi:hypothetical protein